MMATTADEVWALLRELIASQRETERRLQETDRLLRESSADVNRQLAELGRQIGGLGEKFGGFTEGLALPSMERLLRERFGMEVITPSVRVTKEGRHLEIDTMAYANGPINQVYLVEVKSLLRDKAIAQLQQLLRDFRTFFPEHREKQVYGILAAVDIPAGVRARALAAGLYVARIHDQVFALDVPEDFRARAF